MKILFQFFTDFCKVILLAFITIGSTFLNLIEAQKNYIKIDSSYIEGDIRVDKIFKTPNKIQFINNTENITYTANEVNEFVYEYKKYISVKDESESIFVEYITGNKLALYYHKYGLFKRRYFISDSSNKIIALKKNNYKIILNEINTCNFKISEARLNFSKYSIKNCINDINRCKARQYLYAKFGFFTGYTSDLLVVNNSAILFSKDFNYTIGGAIDLPLVRNFFFRTEIHYSRHSQYAYIENISSFEDILIDYSVLRFPLMIKYSIPIKKIVPFVMIGSMYQRIFEHSNQYVLAEYNINGVDLSISKYAYPSKNYWGHTYGIGCDIFLFKHPAFLLYSAHKYISNNHFIKCNELKIGLYY